MSEQLPEIPTVDQIQKFPWAAVSKVQFGVIILLLVFILNNKGGLKEEERSEYQKQVAQANERTFMVQQSRISDYKLNEDLKRDLKYARDTISMVKVKLNSGLIPPAQKILKNEK